MPCTDFNVVLPGTYGQISESTKTRCFVTGSQGSCLCIFVDCGNYVAMAHILSANLVKGKAPMEVDGVKSRLAGFWGCLVAGNRIIAIKGSSPVETTQWAIDAVNLALNTENKKLNEVRQCKTDYQVTYLGVIVESADVFFIRLIKKVCLEVDPEEKQVILSLSSSQVDGQPLLYNMEVAIELCSVTPPVT